MKIGFFDSGIGGLTVLHQALCDRPGEEYLYYADVDHVPYGQRSKEEILQYADEAVSFLVKNGADAIVIACNTATSAAIQTLRSRYALPILGMEPAVKPAITKGHGKRVLVTATPLTLREEKLRNLLHQVDKEHMADLLPLPELVRFAEKEEFSSPRVTEYLRCQLAPFKLEEYSVLVLGCTHFNFFKDTFSSLLPSNVEMIDGSEGTVRYLSQILNTLSPSPSKTYIPGKVTYFFSGRKADSPENLERFERLHRRLEKMKTY